MKNPAPLFTALILSACSASVGTGGLGSENSVREFMSRDDVSRAAVVAEFGEPVRKFSSKDLEVYEYQKITISDRIIDYIPVVALAAAFVGSQTFENRSLFAYFDKSGKLVKFDTVYDSGPYREAD
ncbi:MAG: hypothetical protein LBT45_01030 [Rickettsiales bacterium]|jgi:hypothetical protein|nr:hypothetical protein [Rickettsiales bacterium]